MFIYQEQCDGSILMLVYSRGNYLGCYTLTLSLPDPLPMHSALSNQKITVKAQINIVGVLQIYVFIFVLYYCISLLACLFLVHMQHRWSIFYTHCGCPQIHKNSRSQLCLFLLGLCLFLLGLCLLRLLLFILFARKIMDQSQCFVDVLIFFLIYSNSEAHSSSQTNYSVINTVL
jgi:hypothetical protein